MKSSKSCFSKNIYLFTCLFERERARAQVGAVEGRGEHVKPTQGSDTQRRVRCGAPSGDPYIVTWAETKSLLSSGLCHPGTPEVIFFNVLSDIFEIFWTLSLKWFFLSTDNWR